MHILYFHQHFSTPQGGAGIRSYEMSQRLLKAGHQVTMVCGSSDRGSRGLEGPFKKGRREGIVDGIHVIEFDIAYSNHDGFLKRSWLFVLFALRSIWVVLTHKYDLVFATSTPLTAGIPGIFARWVRRKPFIFEVRDLWPELPKAMGVIKNPLVLGLMSILEWVTYRSAHRLVGLAPGIVEGIVQRGVKAENVTFIPNGCDVSIFMDEVQPWAPEVITEKDFLAIFTGTHGYANGLDSILDAAALLKKRGYENIKFLLVGDGKLKKELQKRARDEGLDNIIFHNPISKIKLAKLMKRADLGLQVLTNIPAFYYGTSPNKFFDYIAAGLPVLNNYPGWLADEIKEHKCGLVVEPDNPTAFANAVVWASENREKIEQMGENAANLAMEKYSRDLTGEKFVKWIEKGLENA